MSYAASSSKVRETQFRISTAVSTDGRWKGLCHGMIMLLYRRYGKYAHSKSMHTGKGIGVVEVDGRRWRHGRRCFVQGMRVQAGGFLAEMATLGMSFYAVSGSETHDLCNGCTVGNDLSLPCTTFMPSKPNGTLRMCEYEPL